MPIHRTNAMKLNDIRVSRKLWGAILILLSAMAAVGYFTDRQSRMAQREADAALQEQEQLITLATQWKGMTEINTQRVLVTTLSTEPNVVEPFAEQLRQGITEISALQKRIVAAATSEADKKALEDVAKARTAVLALTKKSVEVRASGDAAASQKFIDTEMLPATVVYLDALGAFVKLQERQRDEARSHAEEAREHASRLGMLGTIVVFGLATVCATLLVRSINEPLSQSVRLAERIAAGDLTQRVDVSRNDEFGQLMRALQRMNESLARVVGNVRNSTDSIATASAQIATGNHDLSARTEQTASSLQQTAASMQQITETVQQNADAARQANQLASAASQAATRGGRVVGEVVHTMQAITDASQKIADIIGVIDGIAFQTNILALNAAVEAARAGEQGRGFAVVAGEVRSLAQRSAQAAKEIKGLIGSSSEKVEAGAALVQTAGATMQEIVASVSRVTDIMQEITAATTEQSSGIREINQAVGGLDQMTQQNAALVEQAAAAATSMQDQARRLAETVSVFMTAPRLTST